MGKGRSRGKTYGWKRARSMHDVRAFFLELSSPDAVFMFSSIEGAVDFRLHCTSQSTRTDKRHDGNQCGRQVFTDSTVIPEIFNLLLLFFLDIARAFVYIISPCLQAHEAPYLVLIGRRWHTHQAAHSSVWYSSLMVCMRKHFYAA